MTVPVLRNTRSALPDTLAPDGAEIRVLLDRLQGATRLSLAEALVKPDERTACVSHRTIELVCKVSFTGTEAAVRWEVKEAE